MKVAAIDCGTNTTLLLIAEIENGRIEKVFRDEIVTTRLGQDVSKTKRLHPEALARMDECLKRYSEIISCEKPERILCVATSAARDVSNASELFAIGEHYGIPIHVIEGEIEARMTFDGATFDRVEKDGLCVIDVGGGSTEIIGSHSGRLVGKSVNVGSVRLTEMFVTRYPTPQDEVQRLFEYATQKFDAASDDLPKGPIREVIAVAGTPTTLAAVLQNKKYSEHAVHGFKINCATLEDWVYRFAKMDLKTRMNVTGMDKKRADVIVAGTAVLLAALRALRVDAMTVSVRGVRYGIALQAALGGLK